MASAAVSATTHIDSELDLALKRVFEATNRNRTGDAIDAAIALYDLGRRRGADWERRKALLVCAND